MLAVLAVAVAAAVSVVIAAIVLIALYLYRVVARPFARLEGFAEEVAAGNLDALLIYERSIMRKCDEASALVEDLFQHALSGLDRISVQCMPLSAAAVIKRCAADSSGLIQIACRRIDDAVIEADETRLVQVIDNLIGNSIKYAGASPVEIEAVTEGERYLISVRDFGPGMAAEDLPFATERFFRRSNVSDQPGSGLGLGVLGAAHGRSVACDKRSPGS
ncbi:sensor histidine kinase [Adlercreutzia murintestinalis]|uniref:sensor histidine kinase n=1 Tax=Adlercreutzia murintestinalis TaxID=2941325 RepID=UPI00203C903D|nr:HAMP domain-containing sensor histidine kinase [Adlercreutzia murintestinalis]